MKCGKVQVWKKLQPHRTTSCTIIPTTGIPSTPYQQHKGTHGLQQLLVILSIHNKTRDTQSQGALEAPPTRNQGATHNRNTPDPNNTARTAPAKQGHIPLYLTYQQLGTRSTCNSNPLTGLTNSSSLSIMNKSNYSENTIAGLAT